jgi:hypothetical protein
MTEGSWIDGYYDTLDFFFWEPQHLGRQRHENAKLKGLKAVQDNVRTLEVTLNHQIKQFLTLAPSSFRNRLFESVLGVPVSGDLNMAGPDVDAMYDLQNATQPDFLFTSPHSTFSIEMKIKAKSDLAQVLKYAMLALSVEKRDGKRRTHSLVFLARGPFSKLWRQGYATVDDLRLALEAEKHSFLGRRPAIARQLEDRYFEIVSSISIGFMTYDTLAGLMSSEIDTTDSTKGAQVYRNLVGGMVNELNRRGLTPAALVE